MSNQEQQTKPEGGASVSTAGLGLDAEAVQCYLYALLDEAESRGGMFPQTSNEQDSDSDAIHRICRMVKWYGEQGYPRSGEIAKLYAMRARNRGANDQGQQGDGGVNRLRSALVELTAMVRGECPSLLDGDSGGNDRLALEIDDLLTPNVELTGAAPHGQQAKPHEVEK